MKERIEEIRKELAKLEKQMIEGDLERDRILASWKKKQMELQDKNTKLNNELELIRRLEGLSGVTPAQVIQILNSGGK